MGIVAIFFVPRERLWNSHLECSVSKWKKAYTFTVNHITTFFFLSVRLFLFRVKGVSGHLECSVAKWKISYVAYAHQNAYRGFCGTRTAPNDKAYMRFAQNDSNFVCRLLLKWLFFVLRKVICSPKFSKNNCKIEKIYWEI